MTFFSLQTLPREVSLQTAGRIAKFEHSTEIFNLNVHLPLQPCPELEESLAALRGGELVKIGGFFDGHSFHVQSLEVLYRPTDQLWRECYPGNATDSATDIPTDRPGLNLGERLEKKASLYQKMRDFFTARGFLEVHTEALTYGPGTDPHLEPLPTELALSDHQVDEKDRDKRAYLHTSPEFAMKELLARGAGPIFQLTSVWRNGERTSRHRPEFRLLEWYRPWENVEAIITDVEELVLTILNDKSPRQVLGSIARITMQDLVEETCGFDILASLKEEDLREAILTRQLLSPRLVDSARGWDDLFFALTVSHLDPALEKKGAIFVTHWPAPLAVLARRDPSDSRVAERFELYIDGLELANGFGELTDPEEQRRRFEADLEERRRLGYDEIPINEGFLKALAMGLPPSAGVALGMDRLLMLAMGTDSIDDVAAFSGWTGLGGQRKE